MSAEILVHICCAPCLVYPLKALKDEGFRPIGYFYNPNIHPSREYAKRRETLVSFATDNNLALDEAGYDMEDYLEKVTLAGKERCAECYSIRLDATARTAREKGIGRFTTTLLYSRRQKHELIAEKGRDAAKMNGVEFVYKDFREGWNWGIEESKKADLYRQNYCGCIYSEKERFHK